MIQSIYDKAIADILKQKTSLEELIEESKGSELEAFIQRVLSWYNDENKIHMLWEIFRNVFDLDPILFMGSFGSFVSSELLDDSAFRVEYRVLDKIKKDVAYQLGEKKITVSISDLVYENGELKTIPSTKEDPESEPIVFRDNDGTQDIKLLMEAMDKAEFLAAERAKVHQELLELTDLIRESK
jgi:hypothetical protein